MKFRTICLASITRSVIVWCKIFFTLLFSFFSSVASPTRISLTFKEINNVEDVLRRKQVLEEINNVEENNSASSPSSPSQQQEEKTRLEKDAGTPKRQRRLFSRELMAQNMHSNPMERLEGGQPKIEIEMNDTGLSKSNEIERMLSDMREEMNFLKSQATEQQSQISEQQSQISEQQSQISEQQSQAAKQQEEINALKAKVGVGAGVDDKIDTLNSADEIEIHTDPNSGGRYSVNTRTNETKWLNNGDDK